MGCFNFKHIFCHFCCHRSWRNHNTWRRNHCDSLHTLHSSTVSDTSKVFSDVKKSWRNTHGVWWKWQIMGKNGLSHDISTLETESCRKSQHCRHWWFYDWHVFSLTNDLLPLKPQAITWAIVVKCLQWLVFVRSGISSLLAASKTNQAHTFCYHMNSVTLIVQY